MTAGLNGLFVAFAQLGLSPDDGLKLFFGGRATLTAQKAPLQMAGTGQRKYLLRISIDNEKEGCDAGRAPGGAGTNAGLRNWPATAPRRGNYASPSRDTVSAACPSTTV